MKLIAHRGGRGFGTDNTLEAMEKAVKAGVRIIELDVRRTADDRLIVCHDAAIWGHVIGRTSYAELKKHAHERPLLSEVLESLAGWVGFNIEVKEAPEEAVGEMLETYRIESETLVTSFHRLFLERFKKAFPFVRTGFLYRMSYRQERKLETALDVRADVLLPHFNSIYAELVGQAHRLGLEVVAWTVNSEEDLRKLYDWSVDGIVTDHYLDMKVSLERLEGE